MSGRRGISSAKGGFRRRRRGWVNTKDSEEDVESGTAVGTSTGEGTSSDGVASTAASEVANSLTLDDLTPVNLMHYCCLMTTCFFDLIKTMKVRANILYAALHEAMGPPERTRLLRKIVRKRCRQMVASSMADIRKAASEVTATRSFMSERLDAAIDTTMRISRMTALLGDMSMKEGEDSKSVSQERTAVATPEGAEIKNNAQLASAGDESREQMENVAATVQTEAITESSDIKDLAASPDRNMEACGTANAAAENRPQISEDIQTTAAAVKKRDGIEAAAYVSKVRNEILEDDNSAAAVTDCQEDIYTAVERVRNMEDTDIAVAVAAYLEDISSAADETDDPSGRLDGIDDTTATELADQFIMLGTTVERNKVTKVLSQLVLGYGDLEQTMLHHLRRMEILGKLEREADDKEASRFMQSTCDELCQQMTRLDDTGNNLISRFSQKPWKPPTMPPL